MEKPVEEGRKKMEKEKEEKKEKNMIVMSTIEFKLAD